MIGKPSKVSAVEAMEDLKAKFSGVPWFRSVGLDCDEGGWHVDVKVTSLGDMDASGSGSMIRHSYPVKVCLYAVGSGSVKPPKQASA